MQNSNKNLELNETNTLEDSKEISDIIKKTVESELFKREKEEFFKRIEQFKNKKILEYLNLDNVLYTTLNKPEMLLSVKSNTSYHIFDKEREVYGIGKIWFLVKQTLTDYCNEIDLIATRYPRISFVVLINESKIYHTKNPDIMLLEDFKKKYTNFNFNLLHKIGLIETRENIFIPSLKDMELIDILHSINEYSKEEKNIIINYINSL